MNELTNYTASQLPDTLEDLTQFVLVGKAKLQAYMLKLQTVNKLSVAQEIRDQTLKEAQEISTALIAAEQRIGEILLSLPTAQGKRTDKTTSSERSAEVMTKSEAIAEQGYERHEAHDYQQMAKNPEVVQRVMQEALANGEVVTKTQVLKEIKAVRDKAKAEMQDLKEERDYLQAQLEEAENAEPIKVEVVPADYEKAKKKAKQADAYKRDYESEKSKVLKKQTEILRLQDEIAELKRASSEGIDTANISENVFYFCAICNNFISNVGGLVWLTERIADMPEREKDLFLKAARSFNDWSQVFKDNLERSLENGQTRTDTGVPLLTD